ncbi:MAG: tetratricopeptide repeat protein [Gammaproteobacteria bacterium]
MDDKDANPIEAIDFETLQQPVQHNKKSTPLLNTKTTAWVAFIFLLFCGLIVFMFLPKYVAEKRNLDTDTVIKPNSTETFPIEKNTAFTEEKPAQEIQQEPLIQLSPEEISALKLEAEELLLQLIEKQKTLENKAIQQWAKQEFNIALTLGTTGDEHFRKQEYKEAISSYKDAVIVLTDLEERIAPTLAEHLQKGELALSQAEKNTAIIHFELARSIDSENQQAINGLLRAETIKELYVLLEQGGTFEASNRFVDANKIYIKATELDPLSSEAKLALNRVNNRINEIEFTKLLNQGYTSLKLRQFGDARSAFVAAQRLFPNSAKAKQGLSSIEQAIYKEKLSALMAEAEHFEKTEDWNNAAESYQQILMLSPNLFSAQQKLDRNRELEETLTKLDDHIQNKLRLSSESVAKEANQLLNKISTIENPGTKIQQGVITLNNLIQLAKQPVAITLQSDNLTDIVVFKVGKFGKFKQKKLELKIGKYTIVGSRPGFRDVRETFTISNEMSGKTISVRCDEPI